MILSWDCPVEVISEDQWSRLVMPTDATHCPQCRMLIEQLAHNRAVRADRHPMTPESS